MNNVSLIPEGDEGFKVIIDNRLLTHNSGDAFYDFDRESSDAWAVFTTLKALAAAGFIELTVDPVLEERYKVQPVPFTGPAGMIGMSGRDGKDGVCKCEARVADLEYKMETVLLRLA